MNGLRTAFGLGDRLFAALGSVAPTYPLAAPAGVDFPYVTYTRLSLDVAANKDCRDTDIRVRHAVTVAARAYDQCRDLAARAADAVLGLGASRLEDAAEDVVFDRQDAIFLQTLIFNTDIE